MANNQDFKKKEKPRYYATDFPEILVNISSEKRELYLRYQQQFNGIGNGSSENGIGNGSFGNGSFGNGSSSDDPSG